MNLSKVLLVLALLASFVLLILGFEFATVDNPKLFGWLGLALFFGYGSKLVP